MFYTSEVQDFFHQQDFCDGCRNSRAICRHFEMFVPSPFNDTYERFLGVLKIRHLEGIKECYLPVVPHEAVPEVSKK